MNTKSFLLAVAFFVVASGGAVAQNVEWGVKAGLNLSRLTGDVVNPKSVIGFHAGGVADIKLTDKFSIQPELLYSMEGGESSFSYSEEGISIDATERAKLGYLTLPVMAKYFVAEGFSIEAGPQVGYLISGKSEYEQRATFMGETTTDSGTEDIKDQVKSISVGASFGVGYQMSNNLFFQARYYLGLTELNDAQGDDENGFDQEAKIKNSGLQFSIGYKF